MDMINSLADDTICQILSSLPIKEAALTRVLSKRWRYLFALRPNLRLDDNDDDDGVCGGGESFIDFVNSVLAVSGKFPMSNISIKSGKRIAMDDTGHVTRWMTYALEHAVRNLNIDVIAEDSIMVPLEMFTCKTIVELRLSKGFEALIPDDVYLPSLKTLYLDTVYFYNKRYCVLEKLLSACPVLEELTIHSPTWQVQKRCRTVSSSSLKRLTIKVVLFVDFWDLTFDTPNLAYLEYSDLAARKYPVVNLNSLVEANLELRVYRNMSNPTNLMIGLRYVEVLELLSVDTWKMFCYFREEIPVFSNMFRLTITVDFPDHDWEFLPMLLAKCPSLHTLVIKGPLHADTRDREYGLSCPVKVLEIYEYEGSKVGELEQLKVFIEKLPCLELVKVLAYATDDKEKSRITKDLLMVPRSSECNIQITFCEDALPRLSRDRKL
ncbi:unnamed protein product [Microthlaspi erraticum]|uniref:FBD domain-containing protein n=1 Tax=Microthlaspi erraticum TaxID=1685480 RepID=A0A6D2JP33_9BRAS|nr:unnamed protein product [Microthlaspi erraticum]